MTPGSPSRSTRRRWFRGDIDPVAPPGLSLSQWAEPYEALGQLCGWAERYATTAMNWYLRDKQVKRWASRLLRAMAVLFAVGGGIVPLVGGVGGSSNAGYVLIALAAGCVAFDHFFGLSSGWMRDISTAQALQDRLATFHLGWVRWQASGVDLQSQDQISEHLRPNIQDALELINGLVVDVGRLTEAETTQWITNFNSSIAMLGKQIGTPSAQPPVAGGFGEERVTRHVIPDGPEAARD